MLLIGKTALARGLPMDLYAFPVGVPNYTPIGSQLNATFGSLVAGERLDREQRSLKCLGRGDIGLGRSRPHRDGAIPLFIPYRLGRSRIRVRASREFRLLAWRCRTWRRSISSHTWRTRQ